MKDRTIGLSALGLVALMGAASTAGIHPNFSISAPQGLWIDRTINGDLRRGMLVSVCPPAQPLVKLMAEQGYLPYGSCPDTEVAPLLKTVAALPGDRVTLLHGSLAHVNGVPVPNTIAKPSLSAWPDGEYTVKPNQLWVFSSYSKDSFDSRYFGPVDRSAVRGEAAPLLVAGNMEEMK
jgi:conjugative transfer signal peptidase TraF